MKGLAEAVAECATLAAKGGDRSAPLKRAEFDSTDIAISVVSEPRTIHGEPEIKPGKHGLILTKEGSVGGILLPRETARLQSADASIVRLLSFANLSREAWEKGECTVQTFTLQEFHEKR
jgi:AMMECR1 domain-containing protein